MSLADVIDSISSIATDGTRSLINGVKVRVCGVSPRVWESGSGSGAGAGAGAGAGTGS